MCICSPKRNAICYIQSDSVSDKNTENLHILYTLINNIHTLSVLEPGGLGCAGQQWLELDLLGEVPLEDGRDLRPL